jgi:hypothetical protein
MREESEAMGTRALAPGKAEIDNRESATIKGIVEDVTHRPIV